MLCQRRIGRGAVINDVLELTLRLIGRELVEKTRLVSPSEELLKEPGDWIGRRFVFGVR